jgi:methionyl-tRNA formyltransferase
MTERMRLVYFGSGAFGMPTLARLVGSQDVALVVTQPDRRAGRGRHLTPTPVAEYASEHGIETLKPDDVNAAEVVERIRAIAADAFVVIAFGQKLGVSLLDGVFAINLHGSLLPRYRGAAPINWAMIGGETETGVSVITLAQRMDAGEILATRSTAIDPLETAGELHDRLALLGPEAVVAALTAWRAGTLDAQVQDDAAATRAPKLAKTDGTVCFDRPAAAVRGRVHGLTPWPGCIVDMSRPPEAPSGSLKLLRVESIATDAGGPPGALAEDGLVACAEGAVRLLEVQPPGGRAMTFEAYRNGHGIVSGTVLGPRR